MEYVRDPAAIYAKSFATVRAEADLGRFPDDVAECVVRLIHACGVVDIAQNIEFDARVVAAVRGALDAGAPVFCDCEMVRAGIITRNLPDAVSLICTLNDEAVPDLAKALGTTRSAAAVSLWGAALDGAIVVVGNAPTALFALLELMATSAVRPAAILGFPVGFVGAAESKRALADHHLGVPFITLHGRMGGSAIASAALNGISIGARA